MNGLAICAGIGGLELGLKRAIPEYRTVCYIERNTFAASVLVARMEEKALDQAPIWDDLTTFDGKPWREKVDIISAGFPCQPISRIGYRKKDKDPRWIWKDVLRIIDETSPAQIFLENVPGILLAGSGLYEILNGLSLLGYDTEWVTFPVAIIGAPQIRERWFLVANSNLHRRYSWSQIGQKREILNRFTRNFKWEAEPDICRVDDGTPFRMDRLYCLGNAVVPAQAELAWKVLTS